MLVGVPWCKTRYVHTLNMLNKAIGNGKRRWGYATQNIKRTR